MNKANIPYLGRAWYQYGPNETAQDGPQCGRGRKEPFHKWAGWSRNGKGRECLPTHKRSTNCPSDLEAFVSAPRIYPRALTYHTWHRVLWHCRAATKQPSAIITHMLRVRGANNDRQGRVTVEMTLSIHSGFSPSFPHFLWRVSGAAVAPLWRSYGAARRRLAFLMRCPSSIIASATTITCYLPQPR
jgi:hypothetical protein